MKKILLFTSSFPFGKGEQFLYPELNVMARKGYKVLLVPYYYGENKVLREVPEGIDCVSEPLVRNKSIGNFIGSLARYPWLNYHMLVEFISKKVCFSAKRFKAWLIPFIYSPIAISTLVKCKIINEEAICYFYWGNDAALLVPWIKHFYRSVPCIVRNHGSDLYDELFDGYLPLRRLLYKKSNRLIFVSNMGRSYVMNKYPSIDPQKMTVHRLGSRQPKKLQRSKKTKRKVIVSCSNMILLKNVDRIIKILGMLNIEIEWHHFGDGPCRLKIEETASDQSHYVNSNFHGNVSNEEIHNFYRVNKVDLFMNLSDSEGVPVSIMEALSYGIPICAPDIGGIGEIVNEKVGILLERGLSDNGVTNRVKKFLEQEEETLAGYSIRAVQRWREYCDAEVNADRFIVEIIGSYAKDLN
jgi:glycosyltransferase involved in cell wall biosynthesis